MSSGPWISDSDVTEKEFEARLVETAEMLGWKCYHHSDSRRQIAPGRFVGDKHAIGWPDWVLLHRRTRRAVFVELKRQAGVVTDEQQECLDLLRLARLEVYVWRPSNWPHIEKVLAGKA